MFRKALLVGIPMGLFFAAVILTSFAIRKPTSTTSKAYESKPVDLPLTPTLPTPSPQPISSPTATPTATPSATASPSAQTVGDITGDGVVNSLDISALLNKWGTTDPAADLNGDGTVNALDLTQLQQTLTP